MRINFSDERHIPSSNSIFLAGPTLRGSSFDKSWRKDACDILEKYGYNGVVYVPEFHYGDNPFDFINQASWERHGLQCAKYIIFYLNRKFPENPGMTTNVEFGMWLARKPKSIILCSPDGYDKNRYLEWLYNVEFPNGIIYRDLKDSLIYAIHH